MLGAIVAANIHCSTTHLEFDREHPKDGGNSPGGEDAGAGGAGGSGGGPVFTCPIAAPMGCMDGETLVSPCVLPGPTKGTVGGYDTGAALGELFFDRCGAGANESMILMLRGLEKSTWHFVTMHDPNGTQLFKKNKAHCLLEVQELPELEFCDVALIKTDALGMFTGRIPTDSGLTSGDVKYLQSTPTLGNGRYDGLTVVVKNVGMGPSGAPKQSLVDTGGSKELFSVRPLQSFEAVSP